MSRRYADRYEERDREYYDRRAPRGGYDEVDIEIDRSYERRPARAASVVEERYRAPRQPDFLRDDYGRDTAGPLVIRETEKVKEYQRENGKTDMSVAGSRRGPSPPDERVMKEDIIIKERFRDRDNASESGRSRRSRAPREKDEVEEQRIEIRDGPREKSHRETTEEEVIIRRNERDYSPPPRRKEIVSDEREIHFRRGSSRPPPKREVEHEEIYIREERSPPRERVEREVERQELVIRERERSPRRYDREIERDRFVVEDRERERSRPPPRFRSVGPPIATEREEFIFRRRRSPSPRQRSPTPPPRDYEREQIIIRRRESSPPPREPTPEPEPSPELEPFREPSPEPMPLYRPPIVQHIYTHHHHIDHGLARARSPSPPPKAASPPPPAKKHEESLEIEIRRRGIRGGQEYRDKEIIRERDTTERVKEEVQITRKRSESTHHSREKDNGRRDSGRPLRRDMWTEVTKDLVSKEAIEKAGYNYEETSNFFYVIEYLKYEDVLRLVESSEELRREEKERNREIGWRREDEDRASITGGRTKERERIYEHDYIREIRKPARDRDTRSVRSGRYR